MTTSELAAAEAGLTPFAQVDWRRLSTRHDDARHWPAPALSRGDRCPLTGAIYAPVADDLPGNFPAEPVESLSEATLATVTPLAPAGARLAFAVFAPIRWE